MFVTREQVPVSWHEAVAVVRSVADALEDGRLGSVPEPGALALERDGSLQIPPSARHASGDATRHASGLRELLRALLPSDAPTELRALAEGQERGGTGDALADFRQALAYFERPWHENDLRALGARLSDIGEERKLQDEIERLSRKTRTEAEVPSGARQPAAPHRRSYTKVVVALVFLGVVAVAAIATLSVASRGAAGAPGDREAEGKGIVERLRDVAVSAFKKTPPPAPASIEKTTQPAPAVLRRKPMRRPAVAANTTSPQDPLSFVPSVAMLHDLPLLSARTVSSPPPAPNLVQDSTRIHDRSDPDVIPPALLRPHLPTLGLVGLAEAQLGAVEVVVAGDGRVDLVRLVMTTAERRYYDVMILAAVKAWVFRPATRNGQPVRYRVQIPLT